MRMSDTSFPAPSAQIPRPDKTFGGLLREAFGLRHLAACLLPVRAVAGAADAEPVVVLPGYGAGAISTRPLRGYLTRCGFQVHDWGLGRNDGDAWQLVPALQARLEQMRSGTESVAFNLIGWSQGGFNAREVARRCPGLVRQVITLGTPVVGGPKYTIVGRDYTSRGYDLDRIEAEVQALEERQIEVPVTAIFSRADQVVSWQACIDHHSPRVEHIEVSSSHVGLGLRRGVLATVADRLVRNSREQPQ